MACSAQALSIMLLFHNAGHVGNNPESSTGVTQKWLAHHSRWRCSSWNLTIKFFAKTQNPRQGYFEMHYAATTLMYNVVRCNADHVSKNAESSTGVARNGLRSIQDDDVAHENSLSSFSPRARILDRGASKCITQLQLSCIILSIAMLTMLTTTQNPRQRWLEMACATFKMTM